MRKLALLVLPLIVFSLSFTPLEARRAEPAKDYIVVLKDDISVDQAAAAMSSSLQFTAEEKYNKVLKGYKAKLNSVQVERVKKDSRVSFVSEDREVSIAGHRTVTVAAQTLPTGIDRVDADINANEGTGVGVAVLDTGIQLNHPDLQPNIVANKTCVSGTRNGNDDNGHGTHVAGTVAALDNSSGVVGVGSQVKLIAVKVLNRSGSGTWSGVICGIDWVVANAAKYNIKVINMSLSGSGSSDNNCGNSNNDALHRAVCRARDAGITVVVAAGNSNANASYYVPAAYDDAVITVSALADSDGQPGGLGPSTSYGADDTFATFSNYGSVVDLGAPGVNIYSTWIGSSYRTISGTSMASPHVAGAVALYIKSNPGSTWTQVRDAIVASAEVLGADHTDPSGKHPEPVLKANSL